MTEPYFYSIAHVQGAGVAADVLDSEYPFGLPPAEIVERLLAVGCAPAVERMQRVPFPQIGTKPRSCATTECIWSRSAETRS